MSQSRCVPEGRRILAASRLLGVFIPQDLGNSANMTEHLISILSAGQGLGPLLGALTVTLFAGFVKGAVGFAMPLIMISAFSAFLPPELALAGLILPTLVTNLSQAFRQGLGPAKETAWTYRRFLIGTVVFIALSAQLFDLIPRVAYLLLLGVPVTAFAALQLAGVPLALRLQHRARAEWALGVGFRLRQRHHSASAKRSA